MKKTALKRKTPLKRGTSQLKRTAFVIRKKKASMELPEWFKALPPGSHGSTLVQKKAWAFISRMVRQEDFETFGGKCVSCPRRLSDWRDGDCAHWLAWSNCNGIMKFNIKNLALSCKFCNRSSDGLVGHQFGEELKRRYGDNILTEITHTNNKYHGSKLEDTDIFDLITYFHEMGYGATV